MKTDKKIYIVAYDYPPSNGGIARLCYEIKKNILLRHIPVEVVTISREGKDLQNDYSVTRIDGKRPLIDLRMLRYLQYNVNKNDIVITDTWYPVGLISELVCKKVYVLAHGLEFIYGNNKLRKVFVKLIGKKVLSKAQGVIANSQFTGKLVKSISPKANVKAIPLAVDINEFKPTLNKPTDDVLHIFSISRLEKFKGHDFLIDVVAKFNDLYPNKIRLSIGGKGPYKEILEQQVSKLGIESIVSFEGYISDEELCDQYSKNDLFVLCTRQTQDDNNVEGFGLVFCEAQACATPVIGTRTGGISDAIEENNGGWLINQDDETELLDLLIKLFNDKNILKVQGAKARKRMEEYDWSKYTDRLLSYVGY